MATKLLPEGSSVSMLMAPPAAALDSRQIPHVLVQTTHMLAATKPVKKQGGIVHALRGACL